MIDANTAGLIRLAGLIGVALGVMTLFFTERGASLKALGSWAKVLIVASAVLYCFGVMISADSGASRILPQLP